MRQSPLLLRNHLLVLLVFGGIAGGWLFHDLPSGALGQEILLELRLPRLLLAWLAGGALALAGLWLQTLFRFALVEPGLLGVTAGASLGAVLVLWLGAASLFWLPWGAVAGAVLVLLLVLALARWLAVQPEVLLLVGLALSALAGATTQLLLVLGPDQTLRAASFWLMGSFAYADVALLALSWPIFLLLWLWGWRRAAAFDLWLLGERDAGHLGLAVPRFRRQVIWGSAVLVGLVVAQAGSLAFVGLMAPHIASRLAGCHHRALMPMVVVVGALLAMVADVVASRVLAPAELPVGVMMALFGAPFFLYVLYGRWRS